ncbi:ribonuclease Z [Tenuifilum thalassicum]|uniref:Ribonuclease Z n=1 Tax=Tenuifilum thalassicum TaxID=2590900 RepID=A0A7D3XL85_9BACT|nr:ribonuclease Z [Tenuifilum thalassicum]QKG80190.1 ribonuclease Z [Tenuifilum thalassicum]
MTFSVTILGSSSALPTSKRFPSAHVLNVHERFYLIDCGEGTQIQLRKYHLPLNRINNIFLTHSHGDHVLGIFGLISTLNLLGRTNDLHIYGVADFEDLLMQNVKFFTDKPSFKVIYHAVDPFKVEEIYTDKHVVVTTVPLRHRVPAVGYLFREAPKQPNIRKDIISKYNLTIADIVSIKNGHDLVLPNGDIIPNSELTYIHSQPRSYAYCSDTLYSERLVGLVKGVDLLYHEATFLHSELELARKTGHSTALQAATVALKANVGKLILGHFSSRYKDIQLFLNEAKSVFQNSYVINDGDTIQVSPKIVDSQFD